MMEILEKSVEFSGGNKAKKRGDEGIVPYFSMGRRGRRPLLFLFFSCGIFAFPFFRSDSRGFCRTAHGLLPRGKEMCQEAPFDFYIILSFFHRNCFPS